MKILKLISLQGQQTLSRPDTIRSHTRVGPGHRGIHWGNGDTPVDGKG
jgi:hypothetical protein